MIYINSNEDVNYEQSNCTFINPLILIIKSIDELNYESIDKLNYEPSNELNYEPIEELLSDNTIKDKSSENNYYELLDEILSDNTVIDKDPDNNEFEQEIYLITKQLRVKEIIHSLLPMEYPPTSEDGIAIIQYKLGRPCGGGDSDIYCHFLETLVKKSHYTCQGVKLCENLNLDIKNKTHCEVEWM
ncbi:hypothetical protein F8M41_015509 [Gigaspora margarita]|uniref:Uncharacterized protein n=1 Tax=Gigaspora margarita TaxID=4874 RepID=A0A8H4ENG2_GIGMA|nr:hypothetical protein F8M41_015509 [Gigaspora margarita]